MVKLKKLNKFLFLLLIFFGCCQKNPQNATIKNDIIHIDISKDYPQYKNSVVASREFVPLETTNDVLLDRSAMLHYISEKYILVIEQGRGNIFLFDINGKIVSYFNHKGQGPQEWMAMSSVVLDEKNDEIFVFDDIVVAGGGRILVYTLNGKYKRTLKYPTDSRLRLTAYNFDDETMLVYDIEGLRDKTYKNKPYMFLSKKDGSITSTLNISFTERYDTRVITQSEVSGQSYFSSSSVTITNRRHNGQDFVIADVSSDTIYRLTKNRDLIPFIVRTPSVHSTDPHLTCTPVAIADKFILLYITPLDYEAVNKGKAPSVKILMYELETGNIYTVDFRPTWNDVNFLQKNIDARLHPSWKLKEDYNNNAKFKKELEQLSATTLDKDYKKKLVEFEQFLSNKLDEEDNPVVVVERFNKLP